MVPGAGIEPARPLSRGIFLPATIFIADYCEYILWNIHSSTFVVWTFSLPYHAKHDLGRSRQVSTLSKTRYYFSMKLRKYTKEQLAKAVKESTSKRQVLLKLGVAPYGGNYDVLRKALYHFCIDTSHFTGQAWNKGKQLPPKVDLEKYLSNQIPIQSYKLKNRLLKDGVFEHACMSCKRKTWLSQDIPLELDHINGDNSDNRIQNLRLLCPNCHALTPTYRSKNRVKA
jgi:hypothetical protein